MRYVAGLRITGTDPLSTVITVNGTHFNAMNPTLKKLQEIARTSASSSQDSSLRAQEEQVTRAELAAPLIQAFRDVEQEFVRIDVLKQIWPTDYENRNDRVAGLLANWVGPPELPSGLKMWIPYGYLHFDVSLRPDGSHLFVCTRETDGQRPRVMEFVTQEPWLEYFYRVIADVVQM